MEALCFFTCSNSLAKTRTLDYFPPSSSSSSSSSSCPAKQLAARSIHFPCSRPTGFIASKRIRFPSSITSCCQSSDESHREKTQSADWRWFRAKLVANEQALTMDPETAPPVVAVRERWAHRIHAPEKGCLLIATEKLDGVHIFERTVILLLSTRGPQGAFGIILNHPSLMSIKETGAPSLDALAGRPLFFGGPLEEDMFLVKPKGGCEEDDSLGVFEEVMRGLYYGTKERAGCAAEMVKRNLVEPGDFRFFDGYCGWEGSQLREEIDAGYWTLAACSATVIGLHREAALGLWEDVSWLLGPKRVS